MREYKFQMSASGAEIFLYDEVYSYGVSSLVKQIAALSEDAKITLRINSPGGDVYAGIALYNSLLRRRDNVTVIVDGLAASSASYIAMAAGRIIMPANAYMMIHNPFAYMVGDADDLAAYSEVLRKLTSSICRGYAARTGLTDEAVAALLDAETWMTADEAVAAGFADEVEAEVRIAASASMARVVSSYARAPRVLMQALGPADDAGDHDADVAPVDPSGTAPAAPSEADEAEGDPDDGEAGDDGGELAVSGQGGADPLAGELARAERIAQACMQAGHPELIGGYLLGGLTMAQISAELAMKRKEDQAEIANICHAMGRPEAIIGYFRSFTPLEMVRAELAAHRAEQSGGDIDNRHTGVQAPHSADERRRMDGEKPRIDARKIIAGHNARASKWRR
ncbi:Clp protease ClpP [Tistrella bauzanensis]|uniref:head maturation protease, ClpP-related n=1 Tax=Tistrella TaxID=171436 RepID=UPI0031F637B4